MALFAFYSFSPATSPEAESMFSPGVAQVFCNWYTAGEPFGYWKYEENNYPWFFHYKLGWFAIPNNTGPFDDFFFFLNDTGWNWTSFRGNNSTYPWIYNYQRGWAYTLGFMSNPNWWYFIDTKRWEIRSVEVEESDYFTWDTNPVLLHAEIPEHNLPQDETDKYQASFKYLVNKDGRVEDVCLHSKPFSTPQSFVDACLEALDSFIYEPAMRKGSPVTVYFYYQFTLQAEAK